MNDVPYHPSRNEILRAPLPTSSVSCRTNRLSCGHGFKATGTLFFLFFFFFSHSQFLRLTSIRLTVDMSESKTLTANAVPHANGWVRYNSVSGSSSSSWSRNCTLLSLTSSVIIGTFAPYTDPRLCNTIGPPAQFRPSGSNCFVTAVSSECFGKNKKEIL